MVIIFAMLILYVVQSYSTINLCIIATFFISKFLRIKIRVFFFSILQALITALAGQLAASILLAPTSQRVCVLFDGSCDDIEVLGREASHSFAQIAFSKLPALVSKMNPVH